MGRLTFDKAKQLVESGVAGKPYLCGRNIYTLLVEQGVTDVPVGDGYTYAATLMHQGFTKLDIPPELAPDRALYVYDREIPGRRTDSAKKYGHAGQVFTTEDNKRLFAGTDELRDYPAGSYVTGELAGIFVRQDLQPWLPWVDGPNGKELGDDWENYLDIRADDYYSGQTNIYMAQNNTGIQSTPVPPAPPAAAPVSGLEDFKGEIADILTKAAQGQDSALLAEAMDLNNRIDAHNRAGAAPSFSYYEEGYIEGPMFNALLTNDSNFPAMLAAYAPAQPDYGMPQTALASAEPTPVETRAATPNFPPAPPYTLPELPVQESVPPPQSETVAHTPPSPPAVPQPADTSYHPTQDELRFEEQARNHVVPLLLKALSSDSTLDRKTLEANLVHAHDFNWSIHLHNDNPGNQDILYENLVKIGPAAQLVQTILTETDDTKLASALQTYRNAHPETLTEQFNAGGTDQIALAPPPAYNAPQNSGASGPGVG